MKIDNITSPYPPLPSGDNSNRPRKDRRDRSETADNLPMPMDVTPYRLTTWPQRTREGSDGVTLSFRDLRLSERGPSPSRPYPGMNRQTSHGYDRSDPAFSEAYMAYTIFERKDGTGLYVDIVV
jgi:hypothetical protein